MRKGIFIAIFCMIVAGLIKISCTSCNKNKDVTPTQTEYAYDFNKVIIEDYDYIASQYSTFRFLEADAVFDKLVSDKGNPNVISIRTVFQVGDTCIMINHNENDTVPVITKENDHWMECMMMNARTTITLDSALKIAEPYKNVLNTKKLTLRRLVGPPFPEHGEYIFGNGKLFIDAMNGNIRGNVIDEGFTGYFKGSSLE